MRLLRDRRVSRAPRGGDRVPSLGTQMTWIALPWFVLRTTGSPQRMTWVIIAEIVPIAALGFWGGAIAARLGTRRTMLICDLARAPLLASIPILHAAGVLTFPLLLVLVALTGVFIAPYFAVQRSVVPELVGEEQLDIAEATAFFQAANRLTIFLGPPVAGILIGLIGTANVLYIDAVSYLVSFLLILTFVHVPEVEPADQRGIFAGVRFIFRDRLLRLWAPSFTLLDTAWTLLFASLPVLVVTSFDANPKVLGWLFGALGGGALVGAFAALRLVRRFDPLTMTAGAFICQMSSVWLVAVPGPWQLAVCGMAAAGFFMSLVNSPLHALITVRMPRTVRPQAMAAFGVFQSTASPIGLAIAGWALTHFATRAVLSSVLVVQTAAVLMIVVTALAERSTLRAATVDSAA